MASAATQLFDFADKAYNHAKEKPKGRGPVILPLDQRGEGYDASDLIPEDEDTVLSPQPVKVNEANGKTDTSGFPDKIVQAIQTSAEDRNVSIEYDRSLEDERLEEQMDSDDELREAMEDLASTTDTKFDELTDTVDRNSKKQVDILEKSVKVAAQMEATDREALEYQKERDWDLDQKGQDVNVDASDFGEKSDDVRPPEPKDTGMGMLGMFGGGKMGRIFGIIGKVVARFAGLVGIVLLVNDVLKSFFGKGLIELVTDGFSYLKDNWRELAEDGFEYLKNLFTDIPGIIADAVREIGTFLREMLTGVLNMIPGVSDAVDGIKGFFGYGADESVVSEGTVAAADSAMGTVATGGALAATAVGAKKYIQGRRAAATLAEEATTEKPISGKPDATPKRGLFSRVKGAAKGTGKLALIATGLGLAADYVMGDDEEPAEPDVESEDSGIDATDVTMAGTAVAAGAMGINSMRSPAENLKPDVTPKPAAPTPVDKVAKGGMLKRAGRVAGRIPGLSVLMAGADVYNTANDDTLTEDEKTIEYAGAGGSIAGGAAGAALGATLGSVVPVVGTAIGGLIGGAAGAWLGEEAVEGLISGWFSDDDEEPDTETTVTNTEMAKGAESAYQDVVADQEFDSVEQALNSQLVNSDEAKQNFVERLESGDIKTAAQIEARAEELKAQTMDTMSEDKAMAIASAEQNVPPPSSIDNPSMTTNAVTAPMFSSDDVDSATEPTILNSEPIASEEIAKMDSSERDSNIITQQPPSVIAQVNMPEQKESKPKRDSVVARTVQKSTPPAAKPGSFVERPTLNNVPVVTDDPTLMLLNWGYI